MSERYSPRSRASSLPQVMSFICRSYSKKSEIRKAVSCDKNIHQRLRSTHGAIVCHFMYRSDIIISSFCYFSIISPNPHTRTSGDEFAAHSASCSANCYFPFSSFKWEVFFALLFIVEIQFSFERALSDRFWGCFSMFYLFKRFSECALLLLIFCVLRTNGLPKDTKLEM